MIVSIKWLDGMFAALLVAVGSVVGTRAETIVAFPQEKNSGITINGEKVGDLKYGNGWTFMGGVLNVGSGDYVISGTNTKGVVRIKAVANSNITLKNLHIKAAKGQCAFALKVGAEVNLFLEGKNELESGANNAGINVPYGSTLYINGPGQLIAIGGDYGAGIGASTAKKWNDMRVPTEEHEVIGGQKAFKDEYRCGDIIINSGSVGAAGGKWSAGIGGAAPGDAKNGSGGTYGGYVMVNDGAVYAYGGEGAAGIGGGYIGCGGFLQVYGGNVHAVGGAYGAGIGGGYGGNDGQSSSGRVKIFGGKVVAKGGAGGAGIGGGLRGMLCCSTQNFFETDCKQLVEISGGEVEATGGTFNLFGIELGGAGIGGGAYGSLGPNARVEITGGTVKARSCASAGNIGVGTYAYGPGNWPSAKLTIAGGSVNANLDDLNKNMRPRHADTDKYKRFLAKAVVGGLEQTSSPVELSEVIRHDSGNLNPNQPYEYGGKDLYPDESGCIYMWLPYMDDDPYYFTCGGHDYVVNIDASNVAIASFTAEEAHKEYLRTNGTTFDGNGGEPAEQLMLPQGSTYGAFPPSPSLTAWVFIGWYTAKDGGTRKLESDTPTPGETLYAHWQMNTITSRTALDYEEKPCYYEGAKWFGQTENTHDGVDAMRSGVIGPNESTTMYMKDFSGPGKVSFWWNDCSGSKDSLDFCIDGKIVARAGVKNSWRQVAADIPEGPHTLSWVYSKGDEGSAHADCAYVDEFSFTPTPPINDDFAAADDLHGAIGAVEGTTRYSTKETDEPVEYATWTKTTNSVWYVWTVPAGVSSVKFEVTSKEYDPETGKGFRPVIGVHKGSSLDGLSQIVYASDSGSVGTAAVEFDGLTPGEDYRIRISGCFGTPIMGDFVMAWSASESAASWRPENDKRANAMTIDGASGSVKMSTTGASYEEDRPLDDEGLLYEKVDLLSNFEPSATNSVWFRWEAPFTGHADFTTLGSGFNTVLGVYVGDEVIAENVNSEDVPGFTSRVYFQCVKGTVYEVCVAGMDGKTGNLKLNWYATEATEIEVQYDSGAGGMAKKMLLPSGLGLGGAAAEVPAEEDKQVGYEFQGWSEEKESEKKVDEKEIVDKPKVLYAIWTPVIYHVRFDKNGNEVSGTMEDMAVTYDDYVYLTSNAFSRSDYEFLGWNTKADGTGDSYEDGEEIHNLTDINDGVVIFYAQWKEMVEPESASGSETQTDESAVVSYGGAAADVSFSVAQKVMGALYRNGVLVGTVELKFGKRNAKKGTVKVSGSATIIVGGKAKKIGAKAINSPLKDGKLSDTLTFKAPINGMKFEMGADGVFTLTGGGYEMVGAVSSDGTLRGVSAGGVLSKSLMHFNVAMGSVPNFGAGLSLLEAALPTNVPVHVLGGTKWSCDKAASPKYKKFGSAHRLTGLDGAANSAGLKLSYTAKTGVFKGSYRLYATSGGEKPKLKKFTVNVIGFVVDGEGMGEATMKKPAAGPWSVTVK